MMDDKIEKVTEIRTRYQTADGQKFHTEEYAKEHINKINISESVKKIKLKEYVALGKHLLDGCLYYIQEEIILKHLLNSLGHYNADLRSNFSFPCWVFIYEVVVKERDKYYSDEDYYEYNEHCCVVSLEDLLDSLRKMEKSIDLLIKGKMSEEDEEFLKNTI
jgi:hypothetical protein